MIKDKNFEVISKEQKFWQDVKERTIKVIFNMNQELKLNHNVLKFAEQQILLEKEK